jgi:hypothetical protein
LQWHVSRVSCSACLPFITAFPFSGNTPHFRCHVNVATSPWILLLIM